MKLRALNITNFRGYARETFVDFADLTALVGRNDAGKSSLLDALNIYFNDSLIERDDCCVRTGSTTIRISCVFSDLPKELVIDEQYSTALSDEFLLRNDGMLEISKIYDCSATKGKVSNIFAVARHPNAAGLDDLLSLKLAELRAIATQRRIDLTAVNQTVKAQVRKALWNSAADLQLVEREVSLKKESGKDLFDQIQTYLPLFALFKSDRASSDQDAEAQDPMKAAIKEVIRGHEAELTTLVAAIQNPVGRVAVGTGVASCPPHRSLRAELPHKAPTLGV